MKQYIFLLTAIILSSYTYATNKYLSQNGNDNNSGLTSSTPWKTLNKLNANFGTITAGDIIYLEANSIFYGQINIVKSGTSTKPITVTSYGTGNKPIISGFSTLNNWASIGNGIYQSTTANISANVNMVTIDGQPQALGRFPNQDNGTGGYLNFESSTTKSITDNQLATTPNWTGAELVVRKTSHVIERQKITSQSGATIYYTPANLSYGATANGFGYFIQKDIRTLDEYGEWFYNTSTKYLQMYFGNISPTCIVKVATIDYLLNTTRYSNITINGIAFEGANISAINTGSLNANTSNVKILNCDINYSGSDGIYATNADYLTVQGCTINHSNSDGIEIENEGGISSWANINHNVIKNTGTMVGMGAPVGNSYQGITAYSTDASIDYNEIDSTGYTAISFYYSNAKVRNNFINTFCFVKDDGGGINTWNGQAGRPVYTGRIVSNNIIINGIGSPQGTPDNSKAVHGIYMDNGTVNVSITDNTVANCMDGIYVHDAHELTITGNTVFNCADQQILFVHDNIYPADLIRNVTLKNNIMVAKTSSQLCFNFRTVANDINLSGPADNNYFARPVDDNITIGGLSSVIKTTYSLASWKVAFVGKSVNSQKSPIAILPYVINGFASGNLITNGDFASNISSMTFWSPNKNQVTSWDAGRLKISFPTSAPNVYTMIIKPITGTINNTKSYIVRLSTVGGNSGGVIKAYMRKTSAPYSKLVPAQTRSFGTSLVLHEFIFTAPVTESQADLMLEIQQTSGTTYIDDIGLWEAAYTAVDIDDVLRFEYNASEAVKVVDLGANFMGIDGTTYNGSISLQPYTSKVLIKVE